MTLEFRVYGAQQVFNSCKCGCGMRVRGTWHKGHHRRGVPAANNKHRTREELRRKAKAYRIENLARIHRWAKEWRDRNRDKLKVIYERRKFRNYKLTAQEYVELLAVQNGCCAVCLRPETKGKAAVTSGKAQLAIDHCHISGKVRGLLCCNCNAILGHAKDDLDILRAAIAYIERHKR